MLGGPIQVLPPASEARLVHDRHLRHLWYQIQSFHHEMVYRCDDDDVCVQFVDALLFLFHAYAARGAPDGRFGAPIPHPVREKLELVSIWCIVFGANTNL